MFNKGFGRMRLVLAMAVAMMAAPFQMRRQIAIPRYDKPHTPLFPGTLRRFETPTESNRRHKLMSWHRLRSEGELARRVRQIASGQLTASNGLVGPEGLKCNSHGEVQNPVFRGSGPTPPKNRYYECGEGYAHPVGQSCGPLSHLQG
jgi:hypothetical protein